MNNIKSAKILQILDEARLYPSPHNSQPIMVRITAGDELEVFYNLDRGLPAEAFGTQFGYVCTGTYLMSLKIVARHHGYEARETLQLSEMDFTSPDRNHLMARVEFVVAEPTAESEANYEAYLRRQTSRIPYDNKLVDKTAILEAQTIAGTYGHTLSVTQDPAQVAAIIDINQRTLFLDLANDAVHRELMTWLRFSDQEARDTADGLSARTMLINGRILRFMITHRGLWRRPIIGRLVKKVYLNTMRGVRQVAWLSGPFASHEDFIRAGQCFMEIWVALTRHGVFLHPYGTVITNAQSHKALVELTGDTESEGHMTWLLFRLGYSVTPPRSYRRDLSAMLIKE